MVATPSEVKSGIDFLQDSLEQRFASLVYELERIKNLPLIPQSHNFYYKVGWSEKFKVQLAHYDGSILSISYSFNGGWPHTEWGVFPLRRTITRKDSEKYFNILKTATINEDSIELKIWFITKKFSAKDVIQIIDKFIRDDIVMTIKQVEQDLALPSDEFCKLVGIKKDPMWKWRNIEDWYRYKIRQDLNATKQALQEIQIVK